MSVEGYYVTCDDALCTECAPAGFSQDDYSDWQGFEEWTEPLPIFSDTESDSVTHCCECGVVIEHDLTPDGYGYVIEAVREGFKHGRQNPVTVLWLDTFAQWDDDLGAMDELYRLLPVDPVWLEREDLQRYAVLAGWTVGSEA